MEFLTKAREVFYDYEEEVEEDSRSPSLILPPPSMIEKEHMFDKVVTPSDVGKLNRLVIPKQHAERYFPLDASTNEKGLQLNFEDPSGKPWRFRYSYWNSSQSYVMTKGWSRFVKEKRLDAGDTVSFCRGAGESARNRLFIDWKRRPGGIHLARFPLGFQGYHHHNLHQHRRELSSYVMPFSRSTVPLTPIPLSGSPSIGYYNRCGFNPYMVYLRSEIGPSPVGVQLGIRGEREEEEEEEDDLSVMQRKGSSKTVRLFGVDLDCPTSRVSDSDGKFGDQGRPFLASLQLKLGRSEMEECLDI